MQIQHLQLKEIIWEITGECKNNCKYCGSKLVRNTRTPENIILKIAEEISKYSPKEIDISGGDPLLVSKETHEVITKLFKSKDIICKILANRSIKLT